MATTSIPSTLSVEDLMTRGYFPDRVIPPVNSLALSAAIPDILEYIRPKALDILKKVKGAGLPRSRCVTHSVPKRKHLRRSMSIPNPLHQCVLSDEIATSWHTLESTNDLNRQPLFRAQKSVGARYLLKTDIARYYPSIYTHSVPWALHGKNNARSDKKFNLTGNRLDLWLRETQDKQTGGIPIGPDTSFLIGEVLGTALDLQLESKLHGLQGTRSIDDYYLYFATVSDAERGLAALHEVSRDFELDINDPKTEVIQLPERLEPPWKSELRDL